MVKLDFGAEKLPLEQFMPRGKGEFYEVDCPFCGTNQIVQTRKFHQGVRCHNLECLAMLYYPTKSATRDLLPRNETVLVHGLRTSIAVAERVKQMPYEAEEGEPLYYEEGGNYSAGGIMSGYGEWDFDFREAAEALRGTGRELPAYGDAAKFKINLQQFATREGADAVMAHLAEALRKEEEGAE